MMDYDIDIPEYGKGCTLITPYKGYRRAVIVGRDGLHLVVEISSGLQLHVYEDEIEID